MDYLIRRALQATGCFLGLCAVVFGQDVFSSIPDRRWEAIAGTATVTVMAAGCFALASRTTSGAAQQGGPARLWSRLILSLVVRLPFFGLGGFAIVSSLAEYQRGSTFFSGGRPAGHPASLVDALVIGPGFVVIGLFILIRLWSPAPAPRGEQTGSGGDAKV